MEIREFVRKPKKVEAVRVTNDNMTEVANWCLGEIRAHVPHRTGPKFYIQVHLYGAFTGNEKILGKADVGNWIVQTGSGFRIYSNSRFKKKFVKLGTDEGFGFSDIDLDDEMQSDAYKDWGEMNVYAPNVNGNRVVAFSYLYGSYLVEVYSDQWLMVKP